jgi:hypothetical protein
MRLLIVIEKMNNENKNITFALELQIKIHNENVTIFKSLINEFLFDLFS